MFVYIRPAERNDWVTVLQDSTRGRHPYSSVSLNSTVNPDHEGYLELRGLRSKLYTVISSDKVFLYKSKEVRIHCGDYTDL